MIPKSFDAIDKIDIDSLIANKTAESKTLEYKATLPDGRDEDKKEFLADVSSFANASGGDIIYGLTAGVDEEGKKTGAPGAVKPIEGTTPDEAVRRLEAMISDGIEPRMRMQTKAISGFRDDGQGFVILLRIPKSFAAPHIVTFRNTSRFYSRNSAGKYQLDVGEIRNAFLSTESQTDRIKRFHEDRLGKIIADETPIQLTSPSRIVLHIVPLAPFLSKGLVNLPDEIRIPGGPTFFYLQGIIGRDLSKHYNLDGIAFYGPARDKYFQVFKDGVVEVVRAFASEPLNTDTTKSIFFGQRHEKDIVFIVQRFLLAYKQAAVEAPVAVFVALLGCKSSFMFYVAYGNGLGERELDRDPVLLQEVVADKLEIDVPCLMKPAFDAMWNAFGFPRSLSYGDDGKWNQSW